MKPSHCLCLLFLASILVASSAVVTVSPEETTTPRREKAWAAMAPAAAVKPDEAFLASLCAQQPRGRELPWCKQLHARRVGGAARYLPAAPPSRDGEEIDPRFGVSKRLVPSGPNRLHN